MTIGSFDAVASYHLNPYTCGVARFNVSLAAALGVSVVPLATAWDNGRRHPLLSIKLSEMRPDDADALGQRCDHHSGSYSVLLHDVAGTSLEDRIVAGAARVIAANSVLARRLAARRGDAMAAFAPGLAPATDVGEPELTLLTFGMAHKVSAEGYRRVAALAEATGRHYVLEISTALHQGTDFDEEFFSVAAEITAAFGGRVRFLGFLADPEVSRRLQRCSAVVAFFAGGVRENNTSVMGALAHGCAVITNLDADSPDWMRHGETVFDVSRLDALPDPSELRRVGEAARRAVARYDFDALARLITS